MIITLLIIIPLLIKPKYLIVSIFVFLIVILVHLLTMPHSIDGYVKTKVRVIKNTSMGPIVKINRENIFIKTHEKYNLGDIFYVSGRTTIIKNTSDFDIVTYFKSLNTINVILRPNITLLEETKDMRIHFQNYILEGPSSYEKTTPLLLLGIKTHDSKMIYDIAMHMNIVHLFVISGFHISLFFIIINKILSLFKVNKKISL